MPPISSQLYQFSPLAGIIVGNLSLQDKNGNGTIDKGADEGYENFAENYGIGGTLAEKEKSIDSGFHANGVIYGTGNDRLEETEIVNHYYLHIRFKKPEETATIDNALNAYVYANNLPLVWLDDKTGTVMNAVTKILGDGWNNPEIGRTETEAIAMFNQVMRELNIRGRAGTPSSNGGYYSLPEFVTKKAGYCFETAQFGFWFFSELKINSIAAWTNLTPTIAHEIIKLIDSNTIIDYSKNSLRYKIPSNRWLIENPVESLGSFYNIEAKKTDQNDFWTRSAIYNKYDIESIGRLMETYMQSPAPNYQEAALCGEFILNNFDIAQVVNSNKTNYKHNLKVVLLFLFASYIMLEDQEKFDKIKKLLSDYFPNDPNVKKILQNH